MNERHATHDNAKNNVSAVSPYRSEEQTSVGSPATEVDMNNDDTNTSSLLKTSAVFPCAYCDNICGSPGELRNHEQEHAALMPYRCSVCGKGFKHKRSQNRHKKLHSGLRKYKCTMCESGFFRSDHLKLHMKTHEISKYPFFCVLCQRGFNSNSALESHLLVYHKKDSVPVSSEGDEKKAWTEDQDGVENLMSGGGGDSAASAFDSRFQLCSICNVRMNSSEALLAHLDAEHSLINGTFPFASSPLLNYPYSVISEQCDSDAQESFNGHMGARNELKSDDGCSPSGATMDAIMNGGSAATAAAFCNESISCGLCDEVFLSVDHLQKHTLHKHSLKELEASSDPTYDCNLCSRTFDSILALHCHASAVHSTATSGNGDATTGGGSCSTARSSPQMTASQSDAIGSGSGSGSMAVTNSTSSSSTAAMNSCIFQCNQCDAVSTSLKSFTCHMRKHVDTSVKSYLCELCGLNFGCEQLLNAHLCSHYLERESQYGCGPCGRTFVVPDELQKHLLDVHAIHLYRCALCKELYESRVDIQVHFAVHHSNEDIQYRCRSCNALFGSEDQFMSHVQMVHLRKPSFFPASVAESVFNSTAGGGGGGSVELANLRNNTVFKCLYCSDAFDVEYLFEKHLESAHPHQSQAHAATLSSPPPTAAFHKSGGLAVSSRYRTAATVIDDALGWPNNGGVQLDIGLNRVKCNICDKKCLTVHELAQHKLLHCKVIHSESCNVCYQPISSVEQFCCHMRQHNVNANLMSCIICKQSLVSPVEMQVHAKFHLRIGAIPQCAGCGKECDLKSASCSGGDKGEKLLCASCQDATTAALNGSTASSDSGAATLDGGGGGELNAAECQGSKVKDENDDPLNNLKPYQCIKCQKSFSTETEIHAHVATHVLQDGITHYCMLCKKVFDSPSKLQCHLIEHSFVGCSGYQCYLCGLMFSLPQPLQSHMTARHSFSDRPYDCSLCDQKFFFRAELENHIHSEHSSDAERSDQKFICCFCGQCFSTLAVLQCHMNECPSNCKQSDVTITNNSSPNVTANLTTKRNIPNKKTPAGYSSAVGSHPCPHCPKVFNSLNAVQGKRLRPRHFSYVDRYLQRTRFAFLGHSHVHMSVKIHHCGKCKKVFPTAAKLRNHQRQHNGDKPFPCDLCGRFFSRKDNLKVHMKIHYKSNGVGDSLSDLPTMVTTVAVPAIVSDHDEPRAKVAAVKEGTSSSGNLDNTV
ncbi:unnamed protein product [Soboliphyme baturini]|uniref:Zinc finger protein n=1 Tax=Soboliphyme baturini TaxID=241478 RepID=A0A183IBW7_9BILA|nr:unnamed protein product [Soboliphyme baturini]